uniref:Ovule protein n=1 Tax=Parascaris univalens TaxID=6257 RepID=A0A915BES6_PARUN
CEGKNASNYCLYCSYNDEDMSVMWTKVVRFLVCFSFFLFLYYGNLGSLVGSILYRRVVLMHFLMGKL